MNDRYKLAYAISQFVFFKIDETQQSFDKLSLCSAEHGNDVRVNISCIYSSQIIL